MIKGISVKEGLERRVGTKGISVKQRVGQCLKGWNKGYFSVNWVGTKGIESLRRGRTRIPPGLACVSGFCDAGVVV